MASVANADISEVRQASASLAGAGFLPLVGGAGLLVVAAAIGYLTGDAGRFWHAYLLGVMFVTSIGIGGLFFVLGHHITGGRWGTPLRRLAEITAGTLTISAAMFLPVVAIVLTGSADNDPLYSWVDRGMVMSDPILSSKAIYLEPTWFAIRAAVYYGLWIWMARTMLGLSVRQDSGEPVKRARSMQWWAGPMILLFALSVNFASFDWMMSLEPHWFSTMFGVYWFAGSFGCFLAFLLAVAVQLQARGVLSQSITVEQFHDVAKLMFAFVVFWGYIAFSQYMLIWYAAIPEETLWYDIRQQGPWVAWAILLAVGHLFVPFLGFMSRAIRRNKQLMFGWAVWMVLIHWVDLVYLIMPQVREGSSALPVPWMELLTTAGAVGVFAWAWMSTAAGKWLLPVQDPRLPIALEYHNH